LKRSSLSENLIGPCDRIRQEIDEIAPIARITSHVRRQRKGYACSADGAAYASVTERPASAIDQSQQRTGSGIGALDPAATSSKFRLPFST
jgi:hypothetical protein